MEAHFSYIPTVDTEGPVLLFGVVGSSACPLLTNDGLEGGSVT